MATDAQIKHDIHVCMSDLINESLESINNIRFGDLNGAGDLKKLVLTLRLLENNIADIDAFRVQLQDGNQQGML